MKMVTKMDSSKPLVGRRNRVCGIVLFVMTHREKPFETGINVRGSLPTLRHIQISPLSLDGSYTGSILEKNLNT